MNNVMYMYGFVSGVAASFLFIFVVISVIASKGKQNNVDNNTMSEGSDDNDRS